MNNNTINKRFIANGPRQYYRRISNVIKNVSVIDVFTASELSDLSERWDDGWDDSSTHATRLVLPYQDLLTSEKRAEEKPDLPTVFEVERVEAGEELKNLVESPTEDLYRIRPGPNTIFVEDLETDLPIVR